MLSKVKQLCASAKTESAFTASPISLFPLGNCEGCFVSLRCTFQWRRRRIGRTRTFCPSSERWRPFRGPPWERGRALPFAIPPPKQRRRRTEKKWRRAQKTNHHSPKKDFVKFRYLYAKILFNKDNKQFLLLAKNGRNCSIFCPGEAIQFPLPLFPLAKKGPPSLPPLWVHPCNGRVGKIEGVGKRAAKAAKDGERKM